MSKGKREKKNERERNNKSLRVHNVVLVLCLQQKAQKIAVNFDRKINCFCGGQCGGGGNVVINVAVEPLPNKNWHVIEVYSCRKAGKASNMYSFWVGLAK